MAFTTDNQYIDLTGVTTGRQWRPAITTVSHLHAEVSVYTPAEGGGSYCFHATCTHNHPDTQAGVEATEECAARLRRIIESRRELPKWAVLRNG